MDNPNVKKLYPLSGALGLKFVSAGPTADHPGFDSEQVKAKIGITRYATLSAKLTRMFACGHSTYAVDHPYAGYEVPCLYADDVEAFLKAGG